MVDIRKVYGLINLWGDGVGSYYMNDSKLSEKVFKDALEICEKEAHVVKGIIPTQRAYIFNGRYNSGISLEWFKDGKLHNDDGPARVWDGGQREWYKRGKLHNEDGPAVIDADGTKWWYIDGTNYSEEEFNKKIKERDGIEEGPPTNHAADKRNGWEQDDKGNRWHFKDGEFHSINNEPAIIQTDGSSFWYKNGVLHRVDGPACIYPTGVQEFWLEGIHYSKKEYKKKMKKLSKKGYIYIDQDGNDSHILSGKITTSDGDIKYIQDGVFHREDGPAVIEQDGRLEWCKEGKLHRDDGPAILWPDGSQHWYTNGVLHRLDGPAIIDGDEKEYWIDGTYYSKEEYKKKIKKLKGDSKKKKNLKVVITTTGK